MESADDQSERIECMHDHHPAKPHGKKYAREPPRARGHVQPLRSYGTPPELSRKITLNIGPNFVTSLMKLPPGTPVKISQTISPKRIMGPIKLRHQPSVHAFKPVASVLCTPCPHLQPEFVHYQCCLVRSGQGRAVPCSGAAVGRGPPLVVLCHPPSPTPVRSRARRHRMLTAFIMRR